MWVVSMVNCDYESTYISLGGTVPPCGSRLILSVTTKVPDRAVLLEEGFGAVISQGETQIFRQLLQQGNDALDGS